jgi:hypothetical protein
VVENSTYNPEIEGKDPTTGTGSNLFFIGTENAKLRLRQTHIHYNRKIVKFITKDTKVKRTNITTIYRANENRKVIIKSFKMPSWKAWVQRPVGLIKIGRKRKSF